MSRRAKQKGIESLNRLNGRSRQDDRWIDNETAKDCVICLDVVDVRGVIICAHWFCFVCIFEWSKKTNTCPLCKQRFRCITKMPIGDRSAVPQKVRIRDKNQSNTSIVADDYDVAMGLLSESTDGDEPDGAFDETFEPRSSGMRNARANSNRWSTRTRRSTQEGSQLSMDTFTTTNTPEESSSSRELRPRSRRQTQAANSPHGTRSTTNSAVSSTATNTPQSADNSEDSEDSSSQEQEQVVNTDDSDFSEEEEEEEAVAVVVDKPKRRKKRKSIVYRPDMYRKKKRTSGQRTSGQWIDMSCKKTYDTRKRENPCSVDSLASRSTSRSSFSRSAKQKSLEKLREQRRVLDDSIDFSSSPSDDASEDDALSVEEVSLVKSVEQKPKRKRLRLISDSSIEDDVTSVQARSTSSRSCADKNSPRDVLRGSERRRMSTVDAVEIILNSDVDSDDDKVVDDGESETYEPTDERPAARNCKSESVAVRKSLCEISSDSDRRCSGGRSYHRMSTLHKEDGEEDNDVDEDNDNGVCDLTEKRSTRASNSVTVIAANSEPNKTKYRFRKVERKDYQIPSSHTETKNENSSDTVRKARSPDGTRKTLNVSAKCRKATPQALTTIDDDSLDETCFLTSSSYSTPCYQSLVQTTPISANDFNNTSFIDATAGDYEISPCVLSQVSQQPSLHRRVTPKKSTKRKSVVIETTPVKHDRRSHTKDKQQDPVQSPCLFDNYDGDCSVNSARIGSVIGKKKSAVRSFTFKKLRRTFRHYSPSRPLKNIGNISVD